MPSESKFATNVDKEKKKRFQYDRNNLILAVNAVKNDKMGIREAARIFKVPRTTLQDRLNGRVDEDSKVGKETVLNTAEEQTLVEWLIQLAKCGFPRKKTDLINTVAKIVKDDGRPHTFKNGKPGSKWYNLFMKRHPILSERTPEAISQARAIVTEEFIKKWFQDLLSYLTETGNADVLQDSRRIFNGDETSFSICPKSGKVIGPKGWKNIYDIAKGSEKETITVLIVVSASGDSVPPMVVFPYSRRPPKEIIESAPSSWFIGISESGWMRSGLFYEYIANGLNQWVTENDIQKPIVLFVDGHKSHLTKDLSVFCEENGIILYALPPNTTHLMQPADVSVFRPLKHQWRKTVKEWQDNCGNQTLSKVTFCPLLNETLKHLTRETIINGFRRCGLYPFNPEAVDYTKCVKNKHEAMMQEKVVQEEIISEADLEATLKVLNLCDIELKNVGIDLATVKKIIKQKKDNISEKNTEKDFNVKRKIQEDCDSKIVIKTVKKKKYDEDLTDISDSDDALNASTELNQEDVYVIKEGTLEKPDCAKFSELEESNESVSIINLENTKCNIKDLFPVNAEISESEPLLLIPKGDEPLFALNTGDRNHRSSSPELPAQIVTVCAQIDYIDNSVTVPKSPTVSMQTLAEASQTYRPYNATTKSNTKSLKINNCEICSGACTCTLKRTSLPKDTSVSISNIIMENIDIASDFDFSLPASPSPSLNGQLKMYSPSSRMLKTSPASSRPASRTSTPTSRNTVSPAFKNHLFAPKSLDFGNKRKPKGEKMPLAISSEKWRQFVKVKEDEKEKIVKQREERKKRIELNKAEKIRRKSEIAQRKLNRRPKKVTGKKKKCTSNIENVLPQDLDEKEKVFCSGCEEELISDVEDDALKNIGCDLCPKWFHLKCTANRGRKYDDVSREDFKCHHCMIHLN